MGVPILRGGRVLGVLVVQNRTLRHYTEDEIEVLQTIAMIVAELAASGDLVNPLEIAQSHGGGMLPARIVGVRLNAGLAIGPAVLHEPRVVIRQVVAEDVDAELVRLRGAVAAMREAIDELVETSREFGDGEHHDVIETYRMFAADRGWVDAYRRRDPQRPDRRGGGAEGRGRHAHPDDAGQRSLSARAPVRSRGSRQPAAAAPFRTPAERRLGRIASRIHPGRPRDGAGRAVGLCAPADHWVWCSRKARRPPMSRLWRAPSTSRSSGGSTTRRAGSRRATSSSSTAITPMC